MSYSNFSLAITHHQREMHCAVQSVEIPSWKSLMTDTHASSLMLEDGLQPGPVEITFPSCVCVCVAARRITELNSGSLPFLAYITLDQLLNWVPNDGPLPSIIRRDHRDQIGAPIQRTTRGIWGELGKLCWATIRLDKCTLERGDTCLMSLAVMCSWWDDGISIFKETKFWIDEGPK